MQGIPALITSLPYSFDHIVVVGAGQPLPLAALSAKSPKKMTFVEPDARALPSTASLKQSLPEAAIDIIKKPLDIERQEVTYYLSSVVGYSSQCEPADIALLYPGMTFDKIKRSSVTVDELLERIQLNLDKSNLLILNMNCAEAELLAKSADKLLGAFNCVIIRTSSKPLFGKISSSFDTVIKSVSHGGGVPYSVHPEQSPPFLSVLVNRSEMWHQNRSTFNDSQSMLKQKRSYIESLQTHIESLNKEKEQFSEEVTQIRESLNEKVSELKSKIDELQQESEVSKKAREEENAKNKKLISQLDKVLEEKNEETKQHQHYKQVAQKAESENSLLREQLANANKKESELQKRAEHMKRQRQELDYRQQKLDAEIAKAEAQLELIKDVVLREKAF